MWICVYVSTNLHKFLLHELMKQWALSESVAFLLLEMCLLSKA